MELEKIHSNHHKGKVLPMHNSTGFGRLFDDINERTIDLNDLIVSNKPATQLLRVCSNSMEGAGICNGDIVVVDRGIKPSNGKVVIAILDGEMLIRRYERTINKLYLTPETSKLAKIEVGEYSGCVIWGVVTWVLKQI